MISIRRKHETPYAWAGGALGAGAGVGLLIMFFFDPQSGKRRRNATRAGVVGFFRRRARGAERKARISAAYGSGLTKRATHWREEEKPALDDVTIAHKVETKIFRDADVPKGQINVNVEDGVVFLRGEVDSEKLLEKLEREAAKVQGVKEVRNLLHLPGQPAPMRV
jgi:hypothetical protein